MGWVLDKLFHLGLPFDGEFFYYSGSYFKALWCWYFDLEDDDA